MGALRTLLGKQTWREADSSQDRELPPWRLPEHRPSLGVQLSAPDQQRGALLRPGPVALARAGARGGGPKAGGMRAGLLAGVVWD